MLASLFIEHCPNGLAFYINGELQFHTEDEQIYHEYLVVPAIALAVRRFLDLSISQGNSPNEGLKVLICGGGDGLAARDVLRFPEVSSIDLVDFNLEVLELGKTVFAPFNHNSLSDRKVNIHCQDAFLFLSDRIQNIAKSDDLYHVVICDFTYPTSLEETRVHSQEWFQLVRQVLHPQGLIAENAVSPDLNTSGFWCMYQTMWSAGAIAKPMQVCIPSFHQHGYGNWGFLLAANDQAITKAELTNIHLPDGLRSLNLDSLLAAFSFADAIAVQRFAVNIHSLKAPQLLYYLLNPHPNIIESTDRNIDFLDLDDAQEINHLSQSWMRSLEIDPLRLDSLVKLWLEQMQKLHPDFQKLLPVQNSYHTPRMTASWLGSVPQLLGQINLPRLLDRIITRGKDLPPQAISDLKQLLTKMKSENQEEQIEESNDVALNRIGSETFQFSTSTKLLISLTVTMLVANLIAPDSVFAKGSSGSSSIDDARFGVGFVMTTIGAVWLSSLYGDSKSK
ncbi:MAG: spermine synthase [Pseudanabaena sp.]|nr:MAG: spermine synthase [Pseudanabaena sp.]